MLLLTADPAIHIPEETIGVTEGDNLLIRAAVFSSSPDRMILWYHEGIHIDQVLDTRFNISEEESLSTLTISMFTNDLMGRYQCRIINNNGRSQRDTVQLIQGICSGQEV